MKPHLPVLSSPTRTAANPSLKLSTSNASAPGGSVDSGNFVLSAQWYDGDPFNGGNYIADAPDTNAAYSATVIGSGATSVPEPGSIFLIITGLGLIGVWPRIRA